MMTATLDSIENKIDQILSDLGIIPRLVVTSPVVSPAPVWPLQADCNAFYGNPGDTPDQWASWEKEYLIDIPCPWPLNMDNVVVTQIRINKRCAASLTRVLNNIWDATGHSLSAIQTLRYNLFSGSYNQRPIRGGTMRSMHGFGAAIDWDDQDNQQHALHHLFTDNSLLIVKFKEEGWVWGGDWSSQSIDSMHVQASACSSIKLNITGTNHAHRI